MTLLANVGPYFLGAVCGLAIGYVVAYAKAPRDARWAVAAKVSAETFVFGPVAIIGSGFTSLFLWILLYSASKYLAGYHFDDHRRYLLFAWIYGATLAGTLAVYALQQANKKMNSNLSQ